MQKLALLTVVGSLVGAAFAAGIAVGKVTAQSRFVAVEEVKWEDVGGPKLAALTGDIYKGPYGALLKLPAGFRSSLYSRTGAYEAIEISGTSSHWLKGEDGTKAKKMTPGSYWSIPARVEHFSACAPGADCVFFVWQKTKFDYMPVKDPARLTGSAAGAPAKPAAPTRK